MPVCFSVFDHIKGPRPVFFQGVGQEMARKVALKSQMTLSMMSQKTIESADAVIPFPEEEKIAYVFLFTIEGEFVKEKNSVASLSYIVDHGQQMNFYKQVSLLRRQAEQIADGIKQGYYYDPEKYELSKSLEKTIGEWGQDLASTEMIIEEEVRKTRVTIRRADQRGSFQFFFRMVRKDADQLIRAVILGETIVIVGDEPLVDLMQSTLELFVPHRTLRRVTYTEKVVHPRFADIIGIPSTLAKHYKDEVSLDLKEGKVYRGTKCNFSKKLLKQISKLDQEKAERFIHTRINFVLSQVNTLLNIVTAKKKDKDTLVNFRKSLDEATLEIIDALALQINPLAVRLSLVWYT